MHKCFIIQPFDKDKFDKRCRDTFIPAIEAAGFVPYRVDDDPNADNLIDEIERGIRESPVCLAEITTDNPNVWYEVGYAFANGSLCCLICSSERQGRYPFDIHGRNVIEYKVGSRSDYDDLKSAIEKRLVAFRQRLNVPQRTMSSLPRDILDGVLPEELAALIVLMSGRLIYDDGIPNSQFQQSMFNAGVNELGASMAASNLIDKELIAEVELRDEQDGYPYKALTITRGGIIWLQNHRDILNLDVDPPDTGDDNAPPF